MEQMDALMRKEAVEILAAGAEKCEPVPKEPGKRGVFWSEVCFHLLEAFFCFLFNSVGFKRNLSQLFFCFCFVVFDFALLALKGIDFAGNIFSVFFQGA